MQLLGIISVGFDETYQLLIRFSAFVRYWRKNMGVQLASTSAIHRLEGGKYCKIFSYNLEYT
jgi:hypothetical protein